MLSRAWLTLGLSRFLWCPSQRWTEAIGQKPRLTCCFTASRPHSTLTFIKIKIQWSNISIELMQNKLESASKTSGMVKKKNQTNKKNKSEQSTETQPHLQATLNIWPLALLLSSNLHVSLTIIGHSWAPSACLQPRGSLKHQTQNVCELQTLLNEPWAAFFIPDVMALKAVRECLQGCRFLGQITGFLVVWM